MGGVWHIWLDICDEIFGRDVQAYFLIKEQENLGLWRMRVQIIFPFLDEGWRRPRWRDAVMDSGVSHLARYHSIGYITKDIRKRLYISSMLRAQGLGVKLGEVE